MANVIQPLIVSSIPMANAVKPMLCNRFPLTVSQTKIRLKGMIILAKRTFDITLTYKHTIYENKRRSAARTRQYGNTEI